MTPWDSPAHGSSAWPSWAHGVTLSLLLAHVTGIAYLPMSVTLYQDSFYIAAVLLRNRHAYSISTASNVVI